MGFNSNNARVKERLNEYRSIPELKASRLMLSVQLHKQLREFPLHIEFEVKEAETLVIIGPSGCGKTTSLNLIAGLMMPDAGRIALDKWVLLDRKSGIVVPAEKRGVGYVFQDFALFPHLTVAENVAYGLRARRYPSHKISAKVSEVLNLLGIEDLQKNRPGALSGGERQRVALARALACDAQILLLDEPLGSLDAQTRNQVRGELRRLLKLAARVTIVVTHDYVDALTLGERICVLDHGRIQQIGSRQELLRHPKSRFVAELTGVNFFEGVVDNLHEDGLAEILIGTTRLHATADHKIIGDTTSLAFFPSSVVVSQEPPAGSARNVLKERVLEIIHLGDKVRLILNGSLPICAEITSSALEQMQLVEGDLVYAAVKATAIRSYS